MKTTTNQSAKTISAIEQTTGEAARFTLNIRRKTGEIISRPLLDPVPVPPEPEPPDPEPPEPEPPTPSDWVAELPRAEVDVRYVPASGKTWEVRTAAEMNAALAAYNGGDEIVVLASLTGTFTAARPGQIIVRGATLPPVGTRVTPGNAAGLPKILADTSSPVFTAKNGAGLRLVGLDTGAVPSITTSYTLISFGVGDETSLAQLPKDCVVDRCLVRGHDNLDVRRGVGLQGIACAVVDSWISGIHTVFDGCGIMGWNGPGPYGAYNSHIEGSAENWMFGGADTLIPNVTPSDITLDRCHFFKPSAWNAMRWQLKNLGEAKHVQRLVMRRCVNENNTISTQPGYAAVLSATDQERKAPWSKIENVVFEWNEWKNVIGFSNILGWVYDADRFWTRYVSLRNNLVRPLAPGLGIANLLQRHAAAVEYVNNTFERSDYCFTFEGGAKLDGGLKGIRIINNVAAAWTPIYTPDGLGAIAQYAPDLVSKSNQFVGFNDPLPTTGGVDRAVLATKLAGVVV